jgi:hypothetical protein
MSDPDETTGGEQQEEYPGPQPDDDDRSSGPAEHVPGSQKGVGRPQPEEGAAPASGPPA